ncbi:hypothetical protein Tco_0309035 [Tanacetum coccineum]
MSPKNKEHYQSEKEEIHFLFTGIWDEIYSTVDACKIAHDMWIAIEILQQVITTPEFYKMIKCNDKIPTLIVATMQQSHVQFPSTTSTEWSRFVPLVNQNHDLDTFSIPQALWTSEKSNRGGNVDEGPMLLSLTWPTLSASTSAINKSIIGTLQGTFKSLIMWIHPKLSHEACIRNNILDSEAETEIDDNNDPVYPDEKFVLKNANKVARDMLQRFNMPTQTIPMLSKKPKAATADLHKDLLGTRNPGLGYMAKRAQPVLYDADTLLHPTHHPVSIWDSEEVLVHQVVSMKKMNEKPGHELSREQAYWLPANEIASNASNPATPVTPFVHNRPPPSQVLANLQKVNVVFHQLEGIIKERTTQKPLYVSEWCFDYAKQFVEQQLVPFYDHFKKHIESANATIFKEVKEYEQIFDDLDAEYERCVLDNKNLTIEKKNLLIKNDCLIAECLEKDICSIVLTSDIVVPPSSNCLCEDLRSACDREHTKVLELEAEVLKQQKMVIESEKRNSHLQKTHIDLQLKFQNYKQCIDTSSASNAIFEINKLRKQLQGKDDTIRNLDAQISIMKVLNVGSTEGSCDQQALETDRIQLKDTITSLRIQLDGLKVENVSLKRRYDELSKANTHSRTAYTEKLSALTTQHTKLQAQVTGKTSSGPSTSETPKVLAPGMYNLGSKYIPPPKRANWVKPTPLPKKKQVTFQEPPRTSNRPTQKPPVQQNKKPNVSVNLSTRTKPATESHKPMPKSHTRNHRILPSKSVNARRAADHNRRLLGSHKWTQTKKLRSLEVTRQKSSSKDYVI